MSTFDAVVLALSLFVSVVVLAGVAVRWVRVATTPCFTPRCHRRAQWRTLDHRQWCHACMAHHLAAANLIVGRVK